MCRVDERIYVRADGHRSKFQDTSLCERGKRRGKMCSNVDVRRTEYPDPTSSPMTSSPITPNYYTQARRPSVSSRPSTREGSIKSLKPEIHIGLTVNKGKPHVSITTGKGKRESAGSISAHESAGSEASYPVRTGYPDVSPPSLNSDHGGLRPQSGHYRNPSSDESVPSSSRMSQVYQNSSDYDTPSLATGTTATSSGTRPIIHHTARTSTMPAQINTTLGQPGGPPSPYRTTEFVPRGTRNDGSYAPEITGRDEDRQRRRDEQRKQQEALDREVAANLVREENRRVHFEPSRAQGRAEERANKTFAGRADGREQIRQQENKARIAKEAATKEAALEAAARDAANKRSQTTKPAAPSRRNSVRMSSAEATKQQQLIDAEARQMRKERAEAEVREREEQLYQQQPPAFQQQQPDSRHYDQPVPRRNSLSNQARPDLSRSNSKRGAAPQPRESRREPRQPPVSYYNSTRNDLPQAREQRQLSSSHANRPLMPTAPTADPWDVRNIGQALPDARNMGQPLPSARGPGVGHNFPQPQAGFPYPQQASHRMQQALYTGEYETDSEDDQDLYSPRRKH